MGRKFFDPSRFLFDIQFAASGSTVSVMPSSSDLELGSGDDSVSISSFNSNNAIKTGAGSDTIQIITDSSSGTPILEVNGEADDDLISLGSYGVCI